MLFLLLLIRSHWITITLLILAGITFISLWPLENLPSVPGSDKTHHLVSYALLVFPIALRKPNHWQWVSLFFFCWSGAIELIQPYVNRYGEWLDLVANGVGILVGIIIAQILVRLLSLPVEK